MTLLEVVVALTVFVVGALGTVAVYGLINDWAARNRCAAAAASVLHAAVNKVLTDPWDTTIPVGCQLTGGNFVDNVDDPNDPFDVGSEVTLLSASASPTTGVVTGKLKHNVRAADGAAVPTVLVDFKLTYVFRGQSYDSTAATVRARDR